MYNVRKLYKKQYICEYKMYVNYIKKNSKYVNEKCE